MQTIEAEIDKFKINYIRSKWRFVVILLFILLTVTYYFPIYGIIWFNFEEVYQMGDKLYGIVNPFMVAPYLSGFFLLWVCIFHGDIVLKILFYIIFLITLMISVYYITGITAKSECIIYMPFVLFMLLGGKIILNDWIRYRNTRKQSDI